MAKLSNRARNLKTGLPVTGGSVIVTGPDGSQLASLSPDSNTGLWTFKRNGQPGATRQTYTSQGQTKIIEGDTFGQVGVVCEGELAEYFRLFNDGVMRGVEEELAVTPISGLQVQVGLGLGLIKGVLHPIYDKNELDANNQPTAKLTLATAPSTTGSSRIDIIAIRLDRTTNASASPARYEGRTYLRVITGTAAATPSAPSLTQNADAWEIELARITVAQGATSLVAGNINSSFRQYATAATVTPADITGFDEAAQDAVGAALTDSSSVDFTYNDASNQITAAVIYGGTGAAATAARSDHNHTGTYATAAHTHSLTSKIVINSNASPPVLSGGQTGDDTASCGGSQLLTGGGCQLTGSQSTILESWPESTTVWRCRARNDSNNSLATMLVYAICINTTI